MSKSLYLIDGSGFIFRAYHSLPPLTNPQGTPVGAVYGFVNMVTKLLEGHQASHIAVIFDAGRQTFRNRIYEAYKANRPPAPEDLIPQFPLVREATVALNLACIELGDYEADDIIATYAKRARAEGYEVTIISSDKDLMQLVGDGIKMRDAMKQKDIGPAEVMEKFGVPPEKVLDVLSLMGDSSDNVPGVPGIGPKTAAELINQFGDMETLLARASEIKQNKRRENLIEFAEQARMSKQLIALEENVPDLPAFSELEVRGLDVEKLCTFLHAQGFKSLVAKFGKGVPAPAPVKSEVALSEPVASLFVPPAPATPTATDYSTVRNETELASWITKAQRAGRVAFDCETTSLNALQAELVGFSFCVNAGEACYVPLAHITEGEGHLAIGQNADLFAPAPTASVLAPNQIPLKRALELLKPLLADKSVLKIGHNIKYDMLVMGNYGIDIFPIEDTMLLSYALHAGEHGQGMDELAERYLNHKNIRFDEVTGTGKKRLTFDAVEIEKATAYAAEDADITLRLWQLMKPQVAAEKLLTLYETIERPLVPVVERMERIGIKIDAKKLAGMSSDFALRMQQLEQDIMVLAGGEFNVASPKQLGEVLFEKLGLEGGKKSAKTGAYGTGNDVLEELAEAGHDIAQKVIDWRQLAKLKNTYCDTLPEQVNPKTGRVHTSFALAIAATGRLSSSDPNLQNIPIRTEEGRKIREAFVAEPGNVLLSADYSQIELRLLAHMADIEVLKEAFRHGDDIHAITASNVFGVPMSEMTSDLRRSAKAVNFGIIYGISAHGLSQQLGIGRSEAAGIIERYFAQYPGIRDYMESCKEFARRHGYVKTLYGRRCHTPMINDRNGARRQFAERAAINAPLQGTAADIIKRAMVQIDGLIAGEPTLNMLLQVHDELIFEVKETNAEAAKPIIKKAMEGAASLPVPLVVEVGSGHHWNEAH